MGSNRTLELKDGFNALITGVRPQTVPISAFTTLKNAVVINNKLRCRDPYYAVSTTDASFTTYGANVSGLIDIQPIKNGYIHFLFRTGTGFCSYRVDNDTSTTHFVLDSSVWRHSQYVKMGSLTFSNICTSGAILGTKVYPTRSSGAISTAPIGLPKPVSIGLTLGTSTGNCGWSRVGNFSHKITWVIDDGYEFTESNASDLGTSYISNVADNYIRVTRPTTPAGYAITHWRVYRRDDVANSDFQLIQTISIATSYFNDSGDNEYVALNDVAPYLDHAQFPESPIVIGQYKNRLWMGSITGKLYYSKVNSPQGSCQYFYSLGYFQVGDPNDEFIRLIETEEYLLVVKRNSIYLVSGTDVSTFTLQKLDDMGSVIPGFTFIYDGYLYYTNSSGIWKWDFYNEPVNLATSIWQDFLQIRSIFDIQLYTYYWFTVFDKLNGLILFIFPTDLLPSAKILVLNPKTNLWVGSYDFGLVSAGCNLSVDTKSSHILVSNLASAYKLYISDPGPSFTILTTGPESTFNFTAITGYTLPDVEELGKKLYRFAHVVTRLLPESSSQSTGSINFTVLKYDGTTASFSSSLPVGPTILINKIHIGVTSELLAFVFYGTSISAVKTIEIEAVKIEYENTGHY